MDIINPLAERYAERHTTPLDDLLAEIERETYAHHAQPHMLSGHVQGKLLEQLSLMVRPAKILEIGTFTGFSALCLAKGLVPGGELHTIEYRPEDAALAQAYFDRSPFKNQVFQHTGDAKEIIKLLSHTWDLVFIDADKAGYIEYYELTLPALRPGGWIIADNVLFHGQVLEEQISGKNAIAINRFNEHVSADNRTEQVMLTVRDGIMLIRKY